VSAAGLADGVVLIEPSETGESSRFVREAHAIVRDLLVPDHARYWRDFLFSISVAYVALALFLSAPLASPLAVVAGVVSSLAMFRAVVFTHELAHRPAGFRRFAVAWNLLCGIPLLLPSFLYGDHKGHHANHTYGTWGDPEYLIRGSQSRWRRLAFLLLALVYPGLPAVRFLLLTPLAMVSRRIDRFVWRYGSSLYMMNDTYVRGDAHGAGSLARWSQEIACSLWAWSVVLLLARGEMSAATIGRVYLVALLWMTINQIRTLTAHRYVHDGSAPMTYLDQVRDTNTFPNGRWLPNLWAPLGLRYHALHHLLPALPYHAMAAAHRRLVNELPPGSPYHQTIRPGLSSVLAGMIGSASASR
jgi:fatty acid desaturase